MSDSEEEEKFCFFGKPLEQYDEDAFPKKKPISVEDQIATDAQGRRRFHGAFTGGFSAGFFNTVGSVEGWKPTEFKSSRSEKAQNAIQKPEDYMDEEDRSEFGIAPETVRARSDYENKSKRKRQRTFADGLIPGEPVLHTLIESGNETIGYLLLKNIGLQQDKFEKTSLINNRVYGCEIPSKYEVSRASTHTENIPEIYKNYLKSPKENTFGMGYVGLSKSHINLFQSSGIVSKEKNKKGFSIKGQAFGVGAFEEEDDDIYAREDMSNYDFELGSERKNKKLAPVHAKSDLVHDLFVLSRVPLINKATFAPPVIPGSFTGKHKVKGSRWDKKQNEENEKTVERKDMNTLTRSRYLGDDVSNIEITPSTSQSTNLLTSQSLNTNLNNQSLNSSSSQSLNSSISQATNIKVEPDERESCNSNDNEANNSSSTSSPFANLFMDRFVSASTSDDHTNLMAPVQRTESIHGTKEQREAAKMKMFGPLTRTYLTWQPNALVCKRFNVPEPKYNDCPKKERKKTQLIFEYQKQVDEDTHFKPGLAIKNEPEESNENNVQDQENNIEMTNVNESGPLVDTNVPSTSTSFSGNAPEKIEANNNKEKVVENTEKEKVIPALDDTQKVDVAKNIDLFKAIFDSSSEDESEKEDETVKETTETNERNELIKANVLGETLIPKINTTKQGILSNVDFSKITFNPAVGKHEFKRKNAEETQTAPEPVNDNNIMKMQIAQDQPKIDVYGPKLPAVIVKNAKEIVISDSSSEDEWIEKGHKEKKKSHKHKKKHKKEKHKKKSKKHKH